MRKNSKKIAKLDMDNMTDEEIDNCYRPRKANSSKKLAPLYVYFILRNQKPGVHLTQARILKLLSMPPYSVQMERKALSSVLHMLDEKSCSGVVCTSDDGCWYDSDKECLEEEW